MQDVRAEWSHPVIGPLFALVPIGLMLLPVSLARWLPGLAVTLWSIGAVTSLLFSWWTLMRWMSARQQPETAIPSWLIAVGGTLNLPLALPALGLAEQLHDVAMFAFATGAFFGVLTFILVFSRFLFQATPPPAALPALLILSAPFSIGYSAYWVVNGGVADDLFARSMFMVLLLVLAVLLPMLRHLRHCCPFRVSWWATGFPLAVAAIASLHFAHTTPTLLYKVIAAALLALTTLVVIGLLIRTTVGIMKGQLRNLIGVK